MKKRLQKKRAKQQALLILEEKRQEQHFANEYANKILRNFKNNANSGISNSCGWKPSINKAQKATQIVRIGTNLSNHFTDRAQVKDIFRLLGKMPSSKLSVLAQYTSDLRSNQSKDDCANALQFMDTKNQSRIQKRKLTTLQSLSIIGALFTAALGVHGIIKDNPLQTATTTMATISLAGVGTCTAIGKRLLDEEATAVQKEFQKQSPNAYVQYKHLQDITTHKRH